MADKEKVGKIVAGCGCAVLAVSAAGGLIFAVIAATSHGRISGDEALPGYLTSCCCSFSSLLVVVVGVAVFIMGKKAREANGG
ncbi:hypothetical protein GW813_14615 [bacterium]|nr:hypothetical protein [bacterium]NCQ61237.1 hypothetical protein [Myxococcales bacterium]